MITIATVSVQDYQGRGAEYTAKLFDAVRRNITLPWRGVVLTDDPAIAPDGIEAKTVPAGLPGWWNKLALHKAGMLPAGEQVLYFDLDSLIVGNIDEIASYCGEFATLKDFFFPAHYQSSVMSWEAGRTNQIWDAFEKTGYPTWNRHGDQGWVESFVPRADLLQGMFPRQIASYKVSCQAGPPAEMRICCFHGLPRPHMVDTAWVRKAWNGDST